MPTLKQSVETNVMNEQGEIVSKRANRVLNWGDEPQFIKLYLQDLLYFTDIPKGHQNVLYALLKYVSYAGDSDGMEIILNSSIKERIRKEVNLTHIRSVNNAISDLVKGQILFKVPKADGSGNYERGIYKLNPYFFGKGDWQDISRLRLEVNYDAIKGKTFGVVINPPDR